MRLLLDTHAFFWAVRDAALLSHDVRDAILHDDNDLYVSAMTAYELAQKHRLGRMPEAADVIASYDHAVRSLGAQHLPMTYQHALEAGQLAWDHRDPFDRILVAQALVEGAVVATRDRTLRYRGPDGLTTLW